MKRTNSSAEHVKGWFSAAREIVGFVRDVLAARKEYAEARKQEPTKEENGQPERKRTPRK